MLIIQCAAIDSALGDADIQACFGGIQLRGADSVRRKKRLKSRLRLRLLSAGALTVAVVGFALLAPAVSDAASSQARANACNLKAATGVQALKKGVSIVDPTPPDKITIPFGTSRAPHSRHPKLSLAKGQTISKEPVGLFVSDFVRSDGVAMDPAEIQARADVDPIGHSLVLTVCVDPKAGDSAASAGSYQGSISLDDARTTAVSVPVTITLRATQWWLAVLTAALAAFAGIIYAVVIGQALNFSSRASTFRAFVTVIASLLPAVPIYLARYASNPSFEGSANDYVTLAVAVGAATIAAYPTIAALVDKAKVPNRAPGSAGVATRIKNKLTNVRPKRDREAAPDPPVSSAGEASLAQPPATPEDQG